MKAQNFASFHPSLLLVILIVAFESTGFSIAHAESRIALFSSEIVVDRDHSLLITDDVILEIPPGSTLTPPTRYFPKRTFGANDQRLEVSIDFLHLLHNGKEFPPSVEPRSHSWQMIMGKPDELLKGTQTYTVQYRVRGAVTSDPNGNYFRRAIPEAWNSPTAKLIIKVQLPNLMLAQSVRTNTRLIDYKTGVAHPRSLLTRSEKISRDRDVIIIEASDLARESGIELDVKMPPGFLD